MRKFVLLIVMFLSGSSGFTSDKSPLVLPSIEQSSAGKALGIGGGALLKGVDALGVNPAGGHTNHREFSTQYLQLPLEVGAGGARLVWPMGSGHWTVGASYSTLQSASLEKRTETGESAGLFSQRDQLAGVTLAGEIIRNSLDLYGGVSLKVIHSQIDRYSGSGLACDLGVLAKMKDSPLTLAMTVLNLGQGPKLDQKSSPWPASVSISVAYGLQKNIALVGGGSVQPESDLTLLSVGGQYVLADHLTLRGNYTLQAGAGRDEADGFNNFSGGLGIRVGAGNLDYTFKPFSDDLADVGPDGSHQATLTVRF